MMNGVGLCVILALQVSLDSDKSNKSVVLETRLVVSHSPLCVTDVDWWPPQHSWEHEHECCNWVRYKWADPSNYQTEEYTWIWTTLDTLTIKNMFHTVHLHISYGPYDRLRYQDANEVPGMFRKGLKRRSWHCASISQNYICSQK